MTDRQRTNQSTKIEMDRANHSEHKDKITNKNKTVNQLSGGWQLHGLHHNVNFIFKLPTQFTSLSF